MSKGPGAVQRIIVSTVTELGPSPLLWIAERSGYDTSKLAVRQSFTRAANKLYASDTVMLWSKRYHIGRRVTIVSLAEPTGPEMALVFVRWWEASGRDGREFRMDAASASLGHTANEGQELVAADTQRINRACRGGWNPFA